MPELTRLAGCSGTLSFAGPCTAKGARLAAVAMHDHQQNGQLVRHALVSVTVAHATGTKVCTRSARCSAPTAGLIFAGVWQRTGKQ